MHAARDPGELNACARAACLLDTVRPDNMNHSMTLLVAALAAAYPLAGHSADAADPVDAPTKTLGVVTITATRPTSLPTQIPTTTEGLTRQAIERTVNATDSEDALKYFPSLLVRKRYIGDYNHAILSSRASGTGNSARSAVYADGILLSNYLGNGVGGLSFPPRWGLVTPEEIERVDVMYGPFSAIYPGNSVGAVVDYVTRMPTKFEAHVKVGYVSQPFDLYDTHTTYNAWQASASLGDKQGDWAWWVNLNHTDSEGQPMTFPTRVVSAGTPGTGGTSVTGAVPGLNNSNQPWYILGTGTQYHTRQDHLKVKLAYDVTPTVRASYVLGLWQNRSDGQSMSYLRDGNGQPVYSGPINIGGRVYSIAPQLLTGGDFPVTRESLLHAMHGFSVKSHTRGEWDWEVAASLYDYSRDDKRQNSGTNFQPAAQTGGSGTLADGSGTGWNNLAIKGTWRPAQADRAHVVDFGYQRDSYQLRYLTSNVVGNYLIDWPGSQASKVKGDTLLQSLYAQDTWKLAPRWKTVLGLRAERWEASNGRTEFSNGNTVTGPSANYAARTETHLSPKAALSWQWLPDTVLKASVGRAVRMPTVNELYGATATTSSQNINDANLRPEKSWTAELSAEKDLGAAIGRLTFFAEDTRDAIYSQTTLVGSTNVSRVLNVGHIATTGLEAALNSEDWLIKGLSLQTSLTYADSIIKQNDGFPDTIGRWQPNIPRWRATAVASYRFDDRWTATLGVRHSGRQYRTLNNSDVNGYTYQGVSPYTTADVRVVWRLAKQWTAAFGIDNLNNDKYWNFHPYPQRSYLAELKFDM